MGPADWLVRARDVRTSRTKNRDVSRPGRRLSEHGCIAAVRSLRRLPRCPEAVRPPPPDYLPATVRRDTAPRGELGRSMRGTKGAGITFCGTAGDGAAGCFEARPSASHLSMRSWWGEHTQAVLCGRPPPSLPHEGGGAGQRVGARRCQKRPSSPSPSWGGWPRRGRVGAATNTALAAHPHLAAASQDGDSRFGSGWSRWCFEARLRLAPQHEVVGRGQHAGSRVRPPPHPSSPRGGRCRAGAARRCHRRRVPL